jgi:GrpB-like predicted nucleotidyltransferase (UPF0157 family)
MELDKTKKRPYSVEPYNSEWVDTFNKIRNRLRDVFKGKALSIEHVGSTSIEGMPSKPIIDVLVIVSKMESFENEKQEMTNKGYQWGEDYIEHNSLLFFKENLNGGKTENIHVLVDKSSKAIQFITTRDYLRLHPVRAQDYGDLKMCEMGTATIYSFLGLPTPLNVCPNPNFFTIFSIQSLFP